MFLATCRHCLYPSQEHEGHEGYAGVAKEIHHHHKHLEGKHVAFSDAGASPGTKMVVVLNQGFALAAVHGPRRSKASDLLVPEPSILSGLFVDDPLEQARISAANTKQCTQRYGQYWNVDEGEPPRKARVAIEHYKVADQSRQNDDEREGDERAEWPTRTRNDNGSPVRLLHQGKHPTDLSCTAAEPPIDIPTRIPRTE